MVSLTILNFLISIKISICIVTKKEENITKKIMETNGKFGKRINIGSFF
jgi:hypothetical protein